MTSKEKIHHFRSFLLRFMDECPCNDTELAFLHDKLFEQDKGYRIIAGGKMKAIGDTMQTLSDIVRHDHFKTLDELIEYFDQERNHMDKYIKGLETMSTDELKELARLQRQQFWDRDNLRI